VKLRLHCILFVGCFFLVFSNQASAAQPVIFHNALSLQGFTGILNTPNAHVTEEGDFYALYSNQKESKWRNKVTFQDNYLFSIGMFNFIELGGRFFEAPGAGRDLSANVKITSAPLTRNYPLMPVIAAGAQDPSGGAVFLKTSYLVLSEDIWRLRVSAGYGSGPSRMNGLFVGGEFKAHDWVYLLGEYDTRETNVGIRAVMPSFWKVPVSFTATAKTSLDYKPGNFEVAVGLSMPLDFKVRPESSRHEERGTRNGENRSEVQGLRHEGKDLNLEPQASILPSTSNLQSLRERLILGGFLNARVGRREKTLVVEYENARYNHNELDALGVVAGIAATAAERTDFETLRIIIRKRDIAMIQVTAPLSQISFFLEKGEVLSSLRETIAISSSIDTDGVQFLEGGSNPGLLKSSLVLAPGLSTWIGTEVGVFDYLLSLKPELTTQAWKGAVVNARWDIPISWSDNLEEGKTYRSSRNDAQLERLMLFQGIKLLPDVMVNLGAGMFLHDINGTVNEMTWSPGDGSQRVHLTQAWTEHSRTHKQNEVYLASYRYYYSPLDLSLEGTAGKFFVQDRGFSMELKRFFNDTAVSLYYKYSVAPDDKKWRAVGIQFAFPLTPRKDMKPSILQARGADEWSYAQETTLKNNNVGSNRGNLNFLPPYTLNAAPNPTMGLLQVYQNRDRLNAAYIKSHLERLREAWLKYKN
jgi:hypothetical protein